MRKKFSRISRTAIGLSLVLAGACAGRGANGDRRALRQTLREGATRPVTKAWPPVPMKFTITLRGQIAGEPFGPLPGEISLLRPVEGDTNPVSLSIATEDQDRQGSLFWISFLADTEPKVRFNSVTVDVEKREVVARMVPVKDLLAPTWVRRIRVPEVPDLGEIADWIQADEGTVRLHLEGTRLEGEVSAGGHGRSSASVSYEARIEGYLQEVGKAARAPTVENPYRGEILFDGAGAFDHLGRFQL